MNLIYNLMGDKSHKLIEQLAGAGFGAEQAQEFLPAALKSVMDALQQVDVQTLLKQDSATQTSELLDKIDMSALADRAQSDNALASTGLRAIIPQIIAFLTDNPAAANLLGGSGTNGLAGMSRGFSH